MRDATLLSSSTKGPHLDLLDLAVLDAHHLRFLLQAKVAPAGGQRRQAGQAQRLARVVLQAIKHQTRGVGQAADGHQALCCARCQGTVAKDQCVRPKRLTPVACTVTSMNPSESSSYVLAWLPVLTRRITHRHTRWQLLSMPDYVRMLAKAALLPSAR